MAAKQLSANTKNHLIVQIPLRTKKFVRSQVKFIFEKYGLRHRCTSTINAIMRALEKRSNFYVPRQLYQQRKKQAYENAIKELRVLAKDLAKLFENVELKSELEISEKNFAFYYRCLWGLHQRIEALPLVPKKDRNEKKVNSSGRESKR
jgi:hypothetical protein